MQYAVVDLGSNTIRLSVYDTRPGGTFELLFSEKEMAGLAGCVEDGVLSQAGIHRACQALTHFQRLARLVGLERVHVFATASLRNIRNTEEALAVIRKACGLEVDVVPGDMEAELGYYGALRTLDLRDGAMFDIGGGSTELVEVRQGQILRAQSLPVGSLNLFSRYVRRVWPRREEIEQLERAVKKSPGAGESSPEKSGDGVRRGGHRPGGSENRQRLARGGGDGAADRPCGAPPPAGAAAAAGRPGPEADSGRLPRPAAHDSAGDHFDGRSM